MPATVGFATLTGAVATVGVAAALGMHPCCPALRRPPRDDTLPSDTFLSVPPLRPRFTPCGRTGTDQAFGAVADEVFSPGFDERLAHELCVLRAVELQERALKLFFVVIRCNVYGFMARGLTPV